MLRSIAAILFTIISISAFGYNDFNALRPTSSGGLIWPNLGGGPSFGRYYECCGYRLDDPMTCRPCGWGYSESSARNQCNFSYVNIRCYSR